MKKIILHSLFVVTALSTFSAHAESNQLKSILGRLGHEKLTFFRGDYSWKKPFEWLALASGAATGTVGAATMYFMPSLDLKTSSKISLYSGAALGIYTLIKMYQARSKGLQIINMYLDEYSRYEALAELSQYESAIIMAAYNQDMNTMKLLAPHITAFLRETGICEVLAELFYRDKDQTEIKFMKSDIQRRLPALRAKLGLQA